MPFCSNDPKCDQSDKNRPRVDFTNILLTVYMHADPKSTKKTVKSSVSFSALGSARAKAARKSW